MKYDLWPHGFRNLLAHWISFLGLPYQVPQTEWTSTTELHYLIVLEARSTRSAVSQDSGSSEGATEGSVPGLPPSFWCLFVLGKHNSLHMAFSLCTCLCAWFSPFYKEARDMGLGTRPTPVWLLSQPITPQKPYFQIKPHSKALGLQHITFCR